MPPRDVDLDREAEQELGQIVVEEPCDLKALVLSLLGHAVRQSTEDLLAILKLLMSFFQSLASEEHRSCQQQRNHEDRTRPETDVCEGVEMRQEEAEECEAQVAD